VQVILIREERITGVGCLNVLVEYYYAAKLEIRVLVHLGIVISSLHKIRI
jgi:hypothetical protein